MKSEKKIKPKKTFYIITSILLVICLGVFCGILFTPKKVAKPKKSSPKVKKEEKVEQNYTLKLLMVGDSLIHTTVYYDAKTADGSYDFRPMLEDFKNISSKYDLAYYNQESILGGASLGYSSYPRFNSPSEVGDAFIDAGFNLVSLANNHTLDKGEIGVLNSNNYWKNHPEVITSGSWSSNEEREKSVNSVYEKNNITYSFLSYTTTTNGLNPEAGKEYLNNVYQEEKVKADIESVRDKVDFVIVAMHWGTEYSFKVTEEQEQIANYLSSLGVDLIIGCHPHVVETVEYINNNRTFVIYSLGNFISDQNDIDNFTGLAMEVTLKKNIDVNNNKNLSVVDPKGELVYTTTKKPKGYNQDFKIVTYPSLTDDELNNHASYYEKYKNIVSERYPSLVWKLSGEE